MIIKVKISLLYFVLIGLSLFSSCTSGTVEDSFATGELKLACDQTKLLAEEALKYNKLPRSFTNEGEYVWAHNGFDWTEGFFPGTCWYMYEFTKDEYWKTTALKLQAKFKGHKEYTSNHDLGFVFNCSYGNAYRLMGDEKNKQVIIDAATSLITRYNENVGCIQSWDVSGGWQAKRGWQYPVIIDNMINLELLFEVSNLTGDDKYRNVAIDHANTTLKNHFRADNSTFHVIDYDSINGSVRHKETAQGYAHESEWARGQAWGLYGYTVCYRYTKDDKYLRKAEDIAKLILNHEALPKDKIPYWDFDAPKIPNEPRDASAAAIIASALLELDQYSEIDYINEASEILQNLSSDNYLAKLGENGKFVIKHCVGSIPHGAEIDVPLNYADYYYVEALLRLKTKEEAAVNVAKLE